MLFHDRRGMPGEGGGLTPRQQRVRERVRLGAGHRFEAGEKTAAIAAELRVGVRRVEKWRQAWRLGGLEALRSVGPHARERLSARQWQRVEIALGQGRLCTAGPRVWGGPWLGSRP